MFISVWVKTEQQGPGELLQLLDIPEWKWDSISMDFIDGLPRSRRGNTRIWVIIDRLTKSAHFILIKSKRTAPFLASLYIREVVRLHGFPSSIVSDRDPLFTSECWRSLQEALGTQQGLSTAYHPQTDGQTERVNRVLEDLLRICILDFGGTWRSTFHWLSWPTVIVSGLVLAWHHSRLCTGDLASHLRVGLSLLRDCYLDQRW